ncbi:hypothetical protein [Henriciella aquimarina]|uniref:hypothetical protein n=1 Tax=Henriciella aquimarina TaxID=545261 RepID=UPI001179B805|nr:hypothetical protein [Henriciella aquimarina]
MATLPVWAVACDNLREPAPGDSFKAYRVCVGDLRLVIPREEAAGFAVDKGNLARQRAATISTKSFISEAGTGFGVTGDAGAELEGDFLLSDAGPPLAGHGQTATSANTTDTQPSGELLDRSITFKTGPHPVPGSADKGFMMTGSQWISDRVLLMMRVNSDEVPPERIPEFLAGLEEALVRWSSGQVLNEPDGNERCPEEG